MSGKKSGKTATVIIILIIIALIALIVVQRTTGFGSGDASKSGMPGMPGAGGMPGASSSQSAVNVEVQEMQKGTFIKTTNISGELEATDETASVTSDVSGKVVEILVAKGQEIRKGDPVAVVDPSVPGSTYKERTIISSFDGTVLSVDVYVGQTINANANVIKVGNPSKLHLVLNIPEKYLSMVENGTSATFTTAAYPETTYNAVVSYVGRSVDKNTRTVETELEIVNPDSRLLEGMFVRTSLITVSLDDVFTVPTKCMSSYLGDSTVYIVRDNRAVRTVVQTGDANDDVTVITAGLAAGDMVVTAGSATDGALVNVINK